MGNCCQEKGFHIAAAHSWRSVGLRLRIFGARSQQRYTNKSLTSQVIHVFLTSQKVRQGALNTSASPVSCFAKSPTRTIVYRYGNLLSETQNPFEHYHGNFLYPFLSGEVNPLTERVCYEPRGRRRG